MKRFAPMLLVLTGWFIAQVAGTPAQVYAQARTSLSSLQAAIDGILSGDTTVGHAAEADFAAEAASLADGVPWSSISNIPGDVVFHGQAVQIGPGTPEANAQNAGTVRYNFAEGTLQVSDGTDWRTLAYEIAP